MTPERWQRIEELYHEALERPANERIAWLASACGGDAELRREIEALLAANDQAEGFLTAPALQLAAQSLAADEQPTQPLSPAIGVKLSHYKILARIGAGGMGEVYLARDARLERRVALKLLPQKFTQDPERLQRFIREAKAASALNHPNIITIYEIGVAESERGQTHFIATEYIEGVTLRDWEPEEESKRLNQTLELGSQTASALDAAHHAGIVHRDIKPENLMVRPDGLVKVLDFGLAKLTATYPSGDTKVDTDAQTTPAEMQTMPGMILGTLRYMSPEQARGRALDARTDIFSLGVVLYELLTGRPLFEGETTADVIAAIIHKEMPPLNTFLPAAPPELERILRKALAKDSRDRYQTARDLQIDLQALKQESELSARMLRSGQSGAVSEATPVQTTIPPTKWQRFSLPVATGAAALFLAAAVWLYLKPAPLAPRPLKFETLLPRKGQEGDRLMRSRLSPDGKWVAFAAPEAENQGRHQLWVMQITGRKPQQITTGTAQVDSPTWSPDGERIAYVSNQGGQRSIWAIPAGGGSPAQIKSFEGTEPATSGSLVRLRVWVKEPEAIFYEWNGNLYQLVLANKEIAKLTNLEAKQNARDFALSPDGRNTVYTASVSGQSDLWRIDLNGGAARRLTNDKEVDGFPVWSADGRRVIYSSIREGKHRLYQVDAAGGASVPVTNNDQQCRVLDLTATSNRLLCYDQREESDIFAVQVAAGAEKQITADLGAECWSSVSPDGQTLAFHSLPGERFAWNVVNKLLLLQPLNHSQPPVQLAADAFNVQWSPDGKHLAFFRRADPDAGLWIVPSFGGEAKALVAAGVSQGGQANSPPYNRQLTKDFSWSPDSSQLAYGARQKGILNIWRVALAGVLPEPLTSNTDAQVRVLAPHWSPDGQRLVYLQDAGKPSTPAQPRWSLHVAGQAGPVFQSATTLRVLGWADRQHLLVAQLNAASTMQATTADLLLIALSGTAPRPLGTLSGVIFNSLQADTTGQQVACVRNEDGKHDVWVLSLMGGRATPWRKITNNTDPNLYYSSPTWSPDGKTIYYDRQTRWSMLTMVDNLD